MEDFLSLHSGWTIKHGWDGLFLFLMKFKKFAHLKQGGTMNCYFLGMMYGRSCTKFPYFVPMVQLIWPP